MVLDDRPAFRLELPAGAPCLDTEEDPDQDVGRYDGGQLAEAVNFAFRAITIPEVKAFSVGKQRGSG